MQPSTGHLTSYEIRLAATAVSTGTTLIVTGVICVIVGIWKAFYYVMFNFAFSKHFGYPGYAIVIGAFVGHYLILFQY